MSYFFSQRAPLDTSIPIAGADRCNGSSDGRSRSSVTPPLSANTAGVEPEQFQMSHGKIYACEMIDSKSVSIFLFALWLPSCGAGQDTGETLPPVDCHYVALPPRFCGPSEDEMLWRESNPQPARVCNGCLADEECLRENGGRCVELPGEGCDYSAFVCVYPGDPCFEGGSCDGRCINLQGRAHCPP